MALHTSELASEHYNRPCDLAWFLLTCQSSYLGTSIRRVCLERSLSSRREAPKCEPEVDIPSNWRYKKNDLWWPASILHKGSHSHVSRLGRIDNKVERFDGGDETLMGQHDAFGNTYQDEQLVFQPDTTFVLFTCRSRSEHNNGRIIHRRFDSNSLWSLAQFANVGEGEHFSLVVFPVGLVNWALEEDEILHARSLFQDSLKLWEQIMSCDDVPGTKIGCATWTRWMSHHDLTWLRSGWWHEPRPPLPS